MRNVLVVSCIILALNLVSGCDSSRQNQSVECGSKHPWYLLHEGKLEEARVGYACLLIKAEKGTDLSVQWNALMEYSWFLHQRGEDKEAIELSNRALEKAVALKIPMMKGRTLSWLAWAYADLGLYDLSESLYKEAIAIGAPGGKILYPQVWGLSTQELGYLNIRRGKLVVARDLLTKTTTFARENRIDVGISEGGAHLAEISFIEGKYREAESFAVEAEAASVRCNCSPLNTARALMIKARVLREREKSDPSLSSQVSSAINDVLAFSKKTGIRRVMAEALLLQSSLFPPDDFERRYAFVASALDILSGIQNEQRGIATAELGRVFLENNRKELAAEYLKRGIAIQESLFRILDESAVRADLSELSAISGDGAARLKELEHSSEVAHHAGALPAALESEEKLAKALSELGYTQLSITWGERAHATVLSLLALSNEVSVKKMLFERKLTIAELIATEKLKQSPVKEFQKGEG